MVPCPLGSLLQCPLNYLLGTWERMLWEQYSPQDYLSGELEAVSCALMLLQRG